MPIQEQLLRARLVKYIDPTASAILAHDIAEKTGSAPGSMAVGMIGPLRFILSFDADGQIEVSVGVGHAPPNRAQLRQFLVIAGLPRPPGFMSLSTGAVFWVAQRGRAAPCTPF